MGVRAMARIIPVLPRKGLLRLARTLSFLAYHIDRRGRSIAEDNLKTALPAEDPKSRARLARASYFHQTMSVLDLMWAPHNLSAKTSTDFIKYTFEDRQDFETIGTNAAIWVTPHYGTFEWLSIEWSLHHDKKPLIVAENFRNPALTPIFTSIREYSGNTIIPQERAMIRLLKHVKRGGQTAFLTDLRIKPSKASTIIKCFGLKTSVPILHAFLAKQTGAPVIPVICLPQSDGTYHFHFHRRLSISEDAPPQKIAQQCWDVFENTLRANPAPWMWMYKHWRYLPKEPQIPYPSYASPSKAFAKVESELEHETPQA